nr:hypothetical protein CFP56_09498 [Quercus suber]
MGEWYGPTVSIMPCTVLYCTGVVTGDAGSCGPCHQTTTDQAYMPTVPLQYSAASSALAPVPPNHACFHVWLTCPHDAIDDLAIDMSSVFFLSTPHPPPGRRRTYETDTLPVVAIRCREQRRSSRDRHPPQSIKRTALICPNGKDQLASTCTL